jgi:hypothetical protein
MHLGELFFMDMPKPDLIRTIYVKGSMEDHAGLVEAIKKVDVVILAVGIEQLMSQMNIIKAIKEVGTVKV